MGFGQFCAGNGGKLSSEIIWIQLHIKRECILKLNSWTNYLLLSDNFILLQSYLRPLKTISQPFVLSEVDLSCTFEFSVLLVTSGDFLKLLSSFLLSWLTPILVSASFFSFVLTSWLIPSVLSLTLLSNYLKACDQLTGLYPFQLIYN